MITSSENALMQKILQSAHKIEYTNRVIQRLSFKDKEGRIEYRFINFVNKVY